MSVEKATEIRRLRESYGISVKEVCDEINMAKGLYSVHEAGSRKYSAERYEKFFHEVANALETIRKRRIEESHRETAYRNQGLKIGDELLMSMISGDYEEDDEDLIYPPITEDLFRKAINMLSNGFNTIQIAVRLEICQLELEKKIGSVKPDFSTDLLLD